MTLPTIETERCLLRPFTLDDAEALNKVNRLPEVMRYIGKAEDTIEKTEAYLKQGPLAGYQQYGYGRHACIDKASGQLIGFSGLKFLPTLGAADLGYRFLPNFWGKGLATETSLALMDFARHALRLEKLLGIAMPDNHASIAVLKKLGMNYVKDFVFMDNPCVLYTLNLKQQE